MAISGAFWISQHLLAPRRSDILLSDAVYLVGTWYFLDRHGIFTSPCMASESKNRAYPRDAASVISGIPQLIYIYQLGISTCGNLNYDFRATPGLGAPQKATYSGFAKREGAAVEAAMSVFSSSRDFSNFGIGETDYIS